MTPARRSAPLSAEELREVRLFLRGRRLEQYYDPAQVAKRTGLGKRTILGLCGRKDGFPNASKPFPNKVRIPESDVLFFLARNRVQTHAPEQEEARNG